MAYSDVAYIAYTGKAAQVLREKGCYNATTAHKLLYNARLDKDTGKFILKPKSNIGDYKVIVCDEVSMLPQRMWDLLLSHEIHVIALGDPQQLKPITGYNNILDRPHIFLTEVMRQAQESEIIRLSMDIRQGKRLQPFKGEDVQVISKKDFDYDMLFWSDIALCALNKTRNKFNQVYREKLYGADLPEPVVGDKIICTKNNWDQVNNNGDALVNGTTGTITAIRDLKGAAYLHTRKEIDLLPDMTIQHKPTGLYNFQNVEIDWKLITKGEPTITKDNWRRFPRNFTLNLIDYGYCATVWKAQGDEWPKVLLMEEAFPYDRDEHKKYLYTGVTRAQEKLILVLKN